MRRDIYVSFSIHAMQKDNFFAVLPPQPFLSRWRFAEHSRIFGNALSHQAQIFLTEEYAVSRIRGHPNRFLANLWRKHLKPRLRKAHPKCKRRLPAIRP